MGAILDSEMRRRVGGGNVKLGKAASVGNFACTSSDY
jgi:hypothetical protein